MTFPLWYLLVPYALVLLGTGIFAFFNVYHIVKFGLQSFGTTALALAYVIGYLGVLALTAVLVGGYDWSASMTLADVFPFAGGERATFGL